MKTFPEIDFKIGMLDDEYIIKLSTIVRKKHTDGLWYKTIVLRDDRISDLKQW